MSRLFAAALVAALAGPAVADTPTDLRAKFDAERAEAAKAFDRHVRMGGKGALLAQPVDDRLALPAAEFDAAFATADAEARAAGIAGGKLTPFLLGRLAELTIGRTLAANEALIVANAGLAAKVAAELVALEP
jgi:pseudouridine-5'-phosphate glycosidase